MAGWQGGEELDLGPMMPQTGGSPPVRPRGQPQTEEDSGCGPRSSLWPVTQTCWLREDGEGPLLLGSTWEPRALSPEPGSQGLPFPGQRFRHYLHSLTWEFEPE